MVEVSRVVVCRDCGSFWSADANEPPGCTDTAHEHVEHELHRHRTRVLLPDGTPVVAVSFHADEPYSRDEVPDYGLYLDQHWAPPWAHDRVDWPDFGVPADAVEVRGKLRQLLDRARDGDRVELGCLGGHGRTGTALACLAVLRGVRASEAVTWVRSSYCDEAVETPEQAAFVADFTG